MGFTQKYIYDNAKQNTILQKVFLGDRESRNSKKETWSPRTADKENTENIDYIFVFNSG